MTSPGPKPQNYDNRKTWQARPWLGRALRISIAAVPLIVALLVTTILGRLFAHSDWSISGRIGWAVAMFLAASLIASGVARFTERLLPLSALCQMNLAFPETAPGRIKLALRLGNSANGDKVVADFQRQGLTPDPQTAAIETLHLVEALNRHDRRTRGHSERVRALADVIAEEMNLPEDDRNLLRWGSLLHDIGKLSVPSEILNKAGKPTAEEWTTLKGHPGAGEWRIKPLESWLGDFAKCVYQHHERYDGTGYPLGIKGDQMPLGSRIVAVADAFECMTATRSYKKAMSYDDARAELVNCSGTHFDPKVVRAFARVGGKNRRFAAGFLSSWTGELVGSQRSILSAISQGSSPIQVLKLGAEAIKTIGVAAVVSTASAAALPVAAPPGPPVTQNVAIAATTLPSNLAFADDGDYQTEFVVAAPTTTTVAPINETLIDTATTSSLAEIVPTSITTTLSVQTSVLTSSVGPDVTITQPDGSVDRPQGTTQASTVSAGSPPPVIDQTPKPATTTKRIPTTKKATTATTPPTTKRPSSIQTTRSPSTTELSPSTTVEPATTQPITTSPVVIDTTSTTPPISVTPTTAIPVATTTTTTTTAPSATSTTTTSTTSTTTTSTTSTTSTTTTASTSTTVVPPVATCWTQELFSNIGLVGPANPESMACVQGFDLMVGRESIVAGLEDNFSARYTTVRTFNGPVTFSILSDDGVRLYIDGNLVFENWTIHPVTLDTYAATLVGSHTISIEYFETILDSVLRFEMSPEPTGPSLALHHVQVPQRPFDTTDGLFVETFAHAGDAKRTDAANSGLVNPSQITIGPDGNLYIADYTEGIVVLSPSGAFVRRFNSGDGVSAPEGLAFNPVDGLLYFFSRFDQSVNTLDVTNGTLTSWLPTNGAAYQSMVFDNNGNLYAVQDFVNRVLKITPFKAISTIVGGGTQTISTPLLGARPATFWNLRDAYDVAFADGSLLISTRDYLLTYDIQDGSLSWLLGNPGGISAGQTAQTFEANARSAAVLPNGSYVVVDQYNGIRIVDTAGNLAHLTAQKWQNETVGDGGDIGFAKFGYPIDVVVDPASGVYVSQDGIRAIRRLT